MTHSMLCESVDHLLEAWHDGELSLEQQVAVESHLAVCASCSATAHELQEVRQVLQTQLHEDVDPGLDRSLDSASRSVISQVAAERAATWAKALRALFEDLHLVWAGLAASAATATCILVIGAVLHFAPERRDDSLSGLITALAEPGSNRNPVQLDERTELPRVHEEDVMPAMFVALPDTSRPRRPAIAVTGVLTQEGRVSYAAIIPAGESGDIERRVMHAVSATRFRPAQRGGSPVAVNLIWLLEQTTVTGKVQG